MAEEELEACARTTQELLGQLITLPKNAGAHLRRPPIAFLHYVMSEVTRKTGFAQGLFPKDLALNDRSAKLSFLRKAIAVVAFALDEAPAAKAEKAVSGLEVRNTHLWLQKLHKAATTCPRSKSEEAVRRLGGEPAAAPARQGGGEATSPMRRSGSLARLEDARAFAAATPHEECEELSRRLQRTESKLRESEDENRRLEDENSQLQARVADLERQLASASPISAGFEPEKTIGRSIPIQEIEVTVVRDGQGRSGFAVEPTGLPRIRNLDASRADLAAMSNGDVIQAVNDIPVDSFQDYKRIAYGQPEFKLSLFRHQVSFEQLDQNGDGVVTREEFAQVMAGLPGGADLESTAPGSDAAERTTDEVDLSASASAHADGSANQRTGNADWLNAD